MQKEVLDNGLTVIYEPKKGHSVVVQVLIKTGSDDEKPEERGLSHFLEHILFEGTINRPDNRSISLEIEKVGGDINAYTSNERTCFYAYVLKKHFQKAVEVLADVLQNPLLREEDIEREKKIVLKEIEMVTDEPRFYQWILLQKTLFNKHPCRYPTYGSKECIKNLTRQNTLQYFQKHYHPSNMIISVVGEVKGWKKVIKKQFSQPKQKSLSKNNPLEQAMKSNLAAREKKEVANTYLVLGFKTVKKNNRDAYALEVINTILGRGQSSRLFTEIRSKKGLAYDVGTQHVAEISYGYFAAYACIDKKNLIQTKELILKEIQRLKGLSPAELKEAQEAIEGEYYLDLEDSQKMADQLLFWEQAKDAHQLNQFIHLIKSVTVNDIRRVIDRYFKNYAFVVLEGKGE
ncbi:insulinase family protein [Candidatus Woesearchaeota archaeon]|nr:insulinase family protein [Candidatus Woesearchaeota archaeon]